MTTRTKDSKEKKRKRSKKKVMKKTRGIFSRIQQTTVLKFYKTRLKKQLELDYFGVEI